ncbi:unnamed protein product [Cladocopium goreaui]|uniref:Uncharacterized protein n=1 Tax=Cladocopium goreaui TaxID=2562237 RepID=A0A9P1CQB7_9DINO|nr:unnamed protein product [Cladocopium goreaui]
MRPALAVEVVEPPESHAHDIPSDDGVLFGIMVASGLLLLIRVAIVLISLCKHPSGAVSQSDEKSRNISKGVVFFVVALATVLMKIASVTAHGLVAINWLLAGAEPGVPLVACFVLVAINTHLLTSVAIVVHLRALLASVAICKQSNIKFQGITNLWGAPAGVACLLMNGVATAILLAYLHHRSGKITTWLATAMSFLLWANTNFKSVGLMDSETWEDVQGSVSKPPIPAAEFMRSIGMMPGSKPRQMRQVQARVTSPSCSRWCSVQQGRRTFAASSATPSALCSAGVPTLAIRAWWDDLVFGASKHSGSEHFGGLLPIPNAIAQRRGSWRWKPWPKFFKLSI